MLVTVREKIGPIATPDFIQNAPGLPKTRSGMFRGLKGLGLGLAEAQWWQSVFGQKPLTRLEWVSAVTR